MANAYNSTTNGPTTLVQTAYDRYIELALRAVPLVRDLADKKPVQQAMPGQTVVFQIYADMAAATAALTETVDPDAVALGALTSVTVTLYEQGNASLTTRKMELVSISDLDPAIADMIAWNQVDSLDIIALNELVGGVNAIAEVAGTLTPAALCDEIQPIGRGPTMALKGSCGRRWPWRGS